MKPKRIGVIGLGSIGMRHATNLIAMGHKILAYDSNPLTYHNLQYKAELFYDLDSLMGHKTHKPPDAFVITSPTQNHLEHSSLAVNTGRHVFVEKPIADRNDHILESFLKQVTMVGYNLRFHSCVKKAKEWLDASLIGTPVWANFVCAQYNDKPAYLRDGVILNWSHEIDLALYLLGSGSVSCSSTRLSDGRDDMTDILLTHENECRTSIHLDYVSDPENRGFYIQGSDGIIKVNLVSRRANLFCSTPTEPFRSKDTNWDTDYIEEMQAFIDRIDGKETIGCTGKEALDVLNICLKVKEQAQQQR